MYDLYATAFNKNFRSLIKYESAKFTGKKKFIGRTSIPKDTKKIIVKFTDRDAVQDEVIGMVMVKDDNLGWISRGIDCFCESYNENYYYLESGAECEKVYKCPLAVLRSLMDSEKVEAVMMYA